MTEMTEFDEAQVRAEVRCLDDLQLHDLVHNLAKIVELVDTELNDRLAASARYNDLLVTLANARPEEIP